MAQRSMDRFATVDVPPGGGIAQAWLADVRVSDDAVKKARRWLNITAILALVGGAVAIVVPAVATLTMTIFIGWLLVYAAVVMAIQTWTQAAARTWERALQALLALIVGAYLVVFPSAGALSLTLVLVIWFAASGILQLVAARRLKTIPGAGWMLLGGVLSIALAVLIALDLPSSAAWAIGLLVGIELIFFATRASIIASMLRRAAA